ncbi:uncharacterized protein RCC_08452 [Ramularia collo-cygni]|uniref:Uncharacterized protein n=1 Tax=Ramularia collo-cygni TaxID=112498 RepID=A0A2D3UXJ5_9PEZI|nr:uncharacterized protein RCC_08452 [Ramularia collo-cygni]CZT22747.1 uncharacterized protein RCC_08452 [Ramularia collo-cygni]
MIFDDAAPFNTELFSSLLDDLKSLRDTRTVDTHKKIIDILIKSLVDVDQTDGRRAKKSAQKAAIAIIHLDPQDEGYQNVAALQDDFWHLMLDIGAQVPSAKNEERRFLFYVMQCIGMPGTGDKYTELTQDDSAASWRKSLASLGPVVRDSLTDPTFKADEQRSYTLNQWVNLNSFVAAIVRVGLIPGIPFAIWSLRHALETEHPSGPDADAAVAVASDWMNKCASPLLAKALLANEHPIGDGEKQILAAGELFQGDPGLSLERWCFWRRRFGVLRGNVSSSAGQEIDNALGAMNYVESEAYVARSSVVGVDAFFSRCYHLCGPYR